MCGWAKALFLCKGQPLGYILLANDGLATPPREAAFPAGEAVIFAPGQGPRIKDRICLSIVRK
jgi:hypothetical protein